MAEFYQGLVDRRGQPIRKADLLEEQARVTTGSVRQPFGDHPAAGLTPGRLASILRESIQGSPMSYLELAEDMEERHEHYSSVLATRKLQVSGLDVTVEAAGDDAESVKHAELVRDFVSRPAFQDELFDILDATGKGFSATEIIWDTSERQWMPGELRWRHPTWFTFDRVTYDDLLLRTDAGDEELKPYQWIVHRAKAKSGLTIRGGLARICAWSFFFKNFTAKDWAIFVEAYGQPLRLGKYGPGATETDKATLLRAVRSIGSDYAAIVPQGMAIDFVEASLTGNHELYEKRSEYLDRQVSKVVLGQVGTTDAVAGGFSGNKIHNEVREDIRDDDARKLSTTINRDLVVPIVSLNFGPQRRYPIVKIGRPDEEDVVAWMENVEKFVSMGGRISEAEARDKIGASEPAEGETLLRPRNSAPATPEFPNDQAPPFARQTAHPMTAELPGKETDAVTQAIDETLADQGWEPLVEPMIEGLEEELATASSLEEAKAILRRRATGLDPTTLAELLARLMFSARLAGEMEEDL